MPRQVTPLTTTKISSAKPRDKEYNLADGNGLYLRVKPQGSKLWIFNYQSPILKKRSNISFGSFPDVSLSQARTERAKCREQLAQNIDPKIARAKRIELESDALKCTLRAVSQEWLDSKSNELSQGYVFDVWNSLENHIFPALGNTPIHEVSPRSVIDVLRPLEASGKLELVKRICQRLSAIMDYAMIADYVEENRLLRVGRVFKSPKKKHLPSIKPERLSELVRSIQNAPVREVTRSLILWQLHTMVRPSEAAGARWCEISLEDSIWTIPEERMKRKRKHVVPLSRSAIRILIEMKERSGRREFVFPSYRDPNKPANSATVNMALRRMGFRGELVSHGFRALASTTLNENGFDPDIIESALAHQDKNKTRAAYNRANYLDARRVMMEWWSSRINDALGV